MPDIFNFLSKDYYVNDHETYICKNRTEMNNLIPNNLYQEYVEYFDFDINVSKLIGRKFNYNDSFDLIDDGKSKNKFRKIYLLPINDLGMGMDVLYNFVLTGNIYRVFLIVDNNYCLCYTNKYSDNKIVKLSLFSAKKPLPVINTFASIIQLGIELNQDASDDENINIRFVGGFFDLQSKKTLVSSNFKIYLDNFYENYLQVYMGKLLCFYKYTVNYIL